MKAVYMKCARQKSGRAAATFIKTDKVIPVSFAKAPEEPQPIAAFEEPATDQPQTEVEIESEAQKADESGGEAFENAENQ